jgi:S1-C subfamily serine protease
LGGKRFRFVASFSSPAAVDHCPVRSVHHLFIAAAIACVVLGEGVAELASASPVIDDRELEERFAAGLQEQGANGLSGADASKALLRVEGMSVEVPLTSAQPATDYEQMCRSVVVVGSADFCKDCNGAHMGGFGTGWVIDPRGRIVTNHHVVEDKQAEELGVMTFDGRVFPVRRILASDSKGDAAILEINPAGEALPALPLANTARTGEAIRVVGHPDGRFYTLSEGVVSRAYAEGNSDDDSRRTWLTVTADCGVGSSGAPVLNLAGEVVGMVSSTSTLLATDEAGKSLPLVFLRTLLGMNPEGKDVRSGEDVQMVFRDCVSIETIRGLMEPTGDR